MPDDARVTKILKHKTTGKYIGLTPDDKVVEFRKYLRHKDTGVRIGIDGSGSVWRYTPPITEDPDVPVTKDFTALERLVIGEQVEPRVRGTGAMVGKGAEALGSAGLRALGVVLGTINAVIYAGPMGTLRGIEEYRQAGEFEGEEPTRFFSAIKSHGIPSALRSMFEKGDWGDDLTSYVKTHTGFTPAENWMREFGIPLDPAERTKRRQVGAFLANAGQLVTELIVGGAFDYAGSAVAASKLIKTFNMPAAKLKRLFGFSDKDVRRAKALTEKREDLIRVLDAIGGDRRIRETAKRFTDAVIDKVDVQSDALIRLQQGMDSISRKSKEAQIISLVEAGRRILTGEDEIVSTLAKYRGDTEDLAELESLVGKLERSPSVATQEIIDATREKLGEIWGRSATREHRLDNLAEKFPGVFSERIGKEVAAINKAQVQFKVGMVEVGKPAVDAEAGAARVKKIVEESRQRIARMDTKEREQKIRKLKDSLPEGEAEAAAYHLRAYDDVMDYMDNVSGTVPKGRAPIERGWEGGSEYVNELTFDMLGLQQTYEQIGKGVRRGYWKLRGYDVDFPGQMSDILEEVRRSYRTLYEANTNKIPTAILMRQEAAMRGVLLRRKGNKWNIIYRKGDEKYPKGKTFTVDKLDEVGEHFNIKMSADEYRDKVFDMEVDMAAKRGTEYFKEWAFPDGIENAGVEEAYRAVQKLEAYITKSKADPKWVERPGDRWIKTQSEVLGRTPTGKAFSEVMTRMRDEAEIHFATDLHSITTIVADSKADPDDIRLILDGFGTKVTDTAAHKAVDDIRPILDKVYGNAEAHGIKTAEYRNNYFTHEILPIDVLKSKNRHVKKMLEECVREGRFKTVQEAEEHLDSFLRFRDGNRTDLKFIKWLAKEKGISTTDALEYWDKYVVPRHVHITGHLTQPRIRDLPWYDRNMFSALGNYLMDTHRATSTIKYMGLNKKIGNEMIDKIRLEGGNWKLAREVLDRYTNPQAYESTSKWGRRLMGAQVITKLNPITTVQNFSQVMATALETSPSSVLKAISRYDKEFAGKSGAVINQTLRDLMEVHGASGAFSGAYLRGIGFMASEKILRGLSANAGKQWAMDLFNMAKGGKRVNFAKRRLREYGINTDAAIKRGRLTEEELKRVGKMVSDRTQFRGDKLDLPVAWLGPYGRLVTQFKTFAYNQARLLKRAVFREAKMGNFRPLAFLSTVYPAVGIGYDVAINQILLGKEPPEGIGWYIRGLTAIGGLGMFQTTLESINYGKKAVLETLVGPSISDIATFTQAWRAVSGDSFNIEKELGGRIPAVGRLVRAALKEQNKRRVQF